MSHPEPTPSGASLVVIVRHGATPWSVQGRHTGRTDLELDESGREQSRRLTGLLERVLAGAGDPVVFSSPLVRATETARLAMPGVAFEETPMLAEVDYGDFEGITAAQIETRQPGWTLFRDGCPGGESVPAIAARCDSFIAKTERMAVGRPVVAFTHGHLGRALAVRLLGWPITNASVLYSDTASVGIVLRRRGEMVLDAWNMRAG